MASYSEVLAIIRNALTLRPTGTKVQVPDHEAAEVALLNYIENKPLSRSAHAVSSANLNCDLTWSVTFPDTNYGFSVSGFSASGDPVEIQLITKANAKIIVKTLVIAYLTATAVPY